MWFYGYWCQMENHIKHREIVYILSFSGVLDRMNWQDGENKYSPFSKTIKYYETIYETGDRL